MARIVMVAAIALFAASGARAADVFIDENLVQSQFLDPLAQLTDTGGFRSRLAQAGVRFRFSYFDDALANPTGGVKQGTGYDGRFGTVIDADLEKLMSWSGATFHASIQQIHGTSFTAGNIDNLMAVSSIEALPSTRLFNLWIEQELSPQASLRVGQFSAAQEFVVSDNAGLFINSTFGWPVLFAQDLPSGGPNYPEGALGARFAYKANDQLTLRAAVFDGNPAGPGTGNPVSRDPHGVDFRLRDPPFLIGELAYTYGQAKSDLSANNPNQEGASTLAVARSSGAYPAGSSLPGSVKLGAWLHMGWFADQSFGAQSEIHHNFSIYGVVDQMVWRVGDRSLSFFARLSAAPGDRNLVDRYVDAGLTFKGLVEGRPDDTAGIAVAFARISPDAAAADSENFAQLGMPTPIGDFEAAIELTYRFSITDQCYLQPDLQYVIHPSGYLASPAQPTSSAPIPNAFIIGLRTVVKF